MLWVCRSELFWIWLSVKSSSVAPLFSRYLLWCWAAPSLLRGQRPLIVIYLWWFSALREAMLSFRIICSAEQLRLGHPFFKQSCSLPCSFIQGRGFVPSGLTDSQGSGYRRGGSCPPTTDNGSSWSGWGGSLCDMWGTVGGAAVWLQRICDSHLPLFGVWGVFAVWTFPDF